MVLLILFTFPFANFSVRSSIIALVWDNQYDAESLPSTKYRPLAFATVMGCVLVGCVLTEVDVVLAYNGAALGSFIVFIFPALIFSALSIK